MVCRDARTHKARKVNPLVLDTEEEKDLFSLGESKPFCNFIESPTFLAFLQCTKTENVPMACALYIAFLRLKLNLLWCMIFTLNIKLPAVPMSLSQGAPCPPFRCAKPS